MEKFKIEPHMDPLPAFARVSALCRACEEEIARDAPCIWVDAEGMFHEDCVEGNKTEVIPVEGAGDSRTMTTSMTREQEGLPGRHRSIWAEARKIADEELPVGPQVALVRCEAGRTYSKERASVRILTDLGLVEKTAWRVTELGRCVVEVLCR